MNLSKQKEGTDDLIASVNRWKEKDQQSTVSITKWKEKNGEALLTIKDLTATNEQLSTSIAELTANSTLLTTTNEQLTKESELITTNNMQLKMTNTELEENLRLADVTMTSLTERNGVLTSKVTELEALCEERKVMNEDLTTQLGEHKILLGESRQEMGKLKKENEEFVTVASYERLKAKFEGERGGEGDDGEGVIGDGSIDALKVILVFYGHDLNNRILRIVF